MNAVALSLRLTVKTKLAVPLLPSVIETSLMVTVEVAVAVAGAKPGVPRMVVAPLSQVVPAVVSWPVAGEVLLPAAS